MNTLKALFPFKAKAKDVGSLIIAIVIYLGVGIIAGAVIGLLSGIPVLGWIAGIVCALIDLYCLVGIVVAVLTFLDIKL